MGFNSVFKGLNCPIRRRRDRPRHVSGCWSSAIHFQRPWFGSGPLALEIMAEKVAQGQGFIRVCLSYPLSVILRMTRTLFSCAYYPWCMMLLGMISTAFVKDTSVSHNATCYVQEKFYRHFRITAKSACYVRHAWLYLCLSVRPSVFMCHRGSYWTDSRKIWY